jgi:hypothetical protein
MPAKSLQVLISEKRKKKPRGYPTATIAFYGPDNIRATKVVVGIFMAEFTDADVLEKYYSEDEDARFNLEIGEQVGFLLKKYGIKTVVAPDRIIGCPHEEGIDYPEGKPCPKCPFWAHRDRFTHDSIQ